MKIAKESSGVLAPLRSALGGVLACVDLYKVGCSVVDVYFALSYIGNIWQPPRDGSGLEKH